MKKLPFFILILSIWYTNAQTVTIEATLDTPCVTLKLIDTTIEDFQVYPNPTKNKLFIDLKNQFNKPSSIKIYDVKGSLVYDKKEFPKDGFINLTKLKNGFYFLILERKEKSITKKLIVQK